MSERVTQQRKILRILAQGRTLNPINARTLVPTLSLSQRITELRAQHWPIEKSWKKLPGGARIRCYRIPEACK